VEFLTMAGISTTRQGKLLARSVSSALTREFILLSAAEKLTQDIKHTKLTAA